MKFLILTLSLVISTIIAEPAWGEAGDAHLYGGGDYLDEKLGAARERLNQSFGLLKWGLNAESLCTVKACRKKYDAGLCQALRKLNPLQRKQCKGYIQEQLAKYQKMNQSKLTPLKLSKAKLAIPSITGGIREVSAKTRHQSYGPIYFNRENVKNLNLESLIALLAHELGHKIGWGKNGSLIHDDKAIGVFKTGRLFLDAVGAALALYAMEHSAPRQAPVPFPISIDSKLACERGSDTMKRFFVGVGMDVLDSVPGDTRLQLWQSTYNSMNQGDDSEGLLALTNQILTSRKSRERIIEQLFLQYLQRNPKKEERKMMLMRVRKGIPYEAVVASLMGDPEYARIKGALGPQQFIVAAHFDLFGRAPKPNELKQYMKILKFSNAATVTMKMMKANTQGWGKWITSWYKELLNRVPSQEELKAQTKKLRSGSGWEAVKASIIATPEYVALQSLRWKECRLVSPIAKK